MDKILDTIETSYVDCQTLLARLPNYRNPRDRIARMVKKGELIRLKNGLFLIASRFQRGEDYPLEQIANILYGPSYVSLEWALAFYGLIPERVSTITCITLGSSKEISTPIATFTYRYLNLLRYSIGIDHREIAGGLGGFLIATPEKALADLVFFTCKHLNEQEIIQDLLESKRIEKEELKKLDLDLLQEISTQYRSYAITHLYRGLRNL